MKQKLTIENLIKDIHRKWQKDSEKKKKYEEKELIKAIEKDLGKFLFKKTEREPIILVAII